MAAVSFRFWEERRVMGAAVSENVEVWEYVMVVQDLEKYFNLLTQPTEITVSLCIFDKQWHTYS